MPLSTPLLKQESVRNFGGEFVTIRLFGDSFDESQREAIRFAGESGGTFIPPYDDLDVIAGQSTIAVEFLEQLPELPTHVFIGIGGGGVAAGIASVIKRNHPDIQVIGVEGAGQDSMSRSIEAGELVTLETLDKFCDGTAVACPGKLPFRLCSMLLDDCVRISNDDACHAIQFLWQTMRVIVEPSAGLAVAAAMEWNFEPNDRPLAILSGSNVDFMMLPKIARLGQVQRPETRYYQFELSEQAGSLIQLLDQFFVNMNIIDFQYGQMSDEIAYPTIGVEVPHSALADLEQFLSESSGASVQGRHRLCGIEFSRDSISSRSSDDPIFRCDRIRQPPRCAARIHARGQQTRQCVLHELHRHWADGRPSVDGIRLCRDRETDRVSRLAARIGHPI